MDNIKKYIFKAIKFFVAYIAIYMALDALFGNFKPITEYIVSGVVFAVFVCVFCYLDERGWNSWKRICSIFKKR